MRRSRTRSRRRTAATEPPIHSRPRCPSSRSGPTSACPPRSTRGTRGRSDVARDVARLVASARPGTVAEHVGSSSVPGHARQERRRPRRRGGPGRDPGDHRHAALARVPAPGRPRAVPADPAAAARQRRPRRRRVPHPPPRDAAGPARAVASWSRSATRCAPTPRCATGTRSPSASSSRPLPDGDANLLYTVHKGSFVQEALYRLGIRTGPADAPEPLPPGSTIGVLGGGQLGRMLALAAREMGYRLVALDPDPDCPAAAVADEIVVGAYDDADAARRLAVDGRRRHLRAGARRARGGRGGRRGRAAATGAGRAAGDPRPARRAARSSARSASGRRRGARSAASTTPAPPRTRWATRCASRPPSAATTAGARSGSRAGRGRRRR